MVQARNPASLIALARERDRVALARLLTMVERGGPESTSVAALAYKTEAPYSVGLTGAPGAGKSTLTDQLITAAKHGWPKEASGLDQIAVLAIDPTSPFSGGAILGDRVRMQDHALDEDVFIRSMATRGHLGGLSLAVPDAVRVLGAASFPLVLIETVGVGQMEVEVASAADTTVVVVNPGWGDSMQANKAGLLEIADLFVINKADRPGVREARRDLEQMLDLSQLGAWRPPILETVAQTGEGVNELWNTIATHRSYLYDSEELAQRRLRRARAELRKVVQERLVERVEMVADGSKFAEQVDAIFENAKDPYSAAEELLS